MVKITVESAQGISTLVLDETDTERIDLAKIQPKLVRDIQDLGADYGFKVKLEQWVKQLHQ